MDSPQGRAEGLWSDLTAAALKPINISEIADIFVSIRRGANSRVLAEQLGMVHAIVGLAEATIAGQQTLTPERSALVVVVAAYLCDPSLSERWFGYSVGNQELLSLWATALDEFGPDIEGSPC